MADPSSNNAVARNTTSEAVALPEGFLYEPNFLSEDEEAELLRAFQGESFEPFAFQQFTAKRLVVRYGVEYAHGTRQVSRTKPFPEFLIPVRDRAAAFAGLASGEALAQGMILEYPPGAPIGWHRDAPQFGTIIGISLLHPARLRFKPYQGVGKSCSTIIEPRSIYVLSGAARSEWQHSIPAMDKPRYSITFRTLREKKARRN